MSDSEYPTDYDRYMNSNQRREDERNRADFNQPIEETMIRLLNDGQEWTYEMLEDTVINIFSNPKVRNSNIQEIFERLQEQGVIELVIPPKEEQKPGYHEARYKLVSKTDDSK